MFYERRGRGGGGRRERVSAVGLWNRESERRRGRGCARRGRSR